MTPPPVSMMVSAIAHHTARARFVCYLSLLSHFLGRRPARRSVLRVLAELRRVPSRATASVWPSLLAWPRTLLLLLARLVEGVALARRTLTQALSEWVRITEGLQPSLRARFHICELAGSGP